MLQTIQGLVCTNSCRDTRKNENNSHQIILKTSFLLNNSTQGIPTKIFFHWLETMGFFSLDQIEPKNYTKHHGIKIINLSFRIVIIRLKGID